MRHRIANSVRHEPRTLVRHAKHPVELVCAHSFFGRAKQMNCHEPLVEWDVAVLENGAHCDRKLFAAGSALPKPLARRQAICPADLSALRAGCLTVRPALRFE